MRNAEKTEGGKVRSWEGEKVEMEVGRWKDLIVDFRFSERKHPIFKQLNCQKNSILSEEYFGS